MPDGNFNPPVRLLVKEWTDEKGRQRTGERYAWALHWVCTMVPVRGSIQGPGSGPQLQVARGYIILWEDNGKLQEINAEQAEVLSGTFALWHTKNNPVSEGPTPG